MQSRRTNSFAYFNLLKFIGAFAIAVYLHYNDHFLPYIGMENPFKENSFIWFVSKYSFVFVEMYFIISGFLFTYAYKKKILEGMHFDFFFSKRLVRIFPLVAITTIVMYLGNLFLYKFDGKLWSCGTVSLVELYEDILLGGKAVVNKPLTLNGPIWYVSVLMLCYIVAYVLTKSTQKQHSIYIYIIPIALGIMIQSSGVNYPMWNLNVARGYIAFFVGVILGELLANFHLLTHGQRLFLRIILLAELILVFVALTCFWNGKFTIEWTNIFAVLVFPEIIILLYDCKWLNKICSTKLFVWLGNISFGIYLWNFPIYIGLHILIRVGIIGPDVTSTKFLLYVAIIHIVVASISYYMIDKKLCGWLNKKLHLTYNQ